MFFFSLLIFGGLISELNGSPASHNCSVISICLSSINFKLKFFLSFLETHDFEPVFHIYVGIRLIRQTG